MEASYFRQMSSSYKIHEDGLYFVTCTVVGWLDIFTRSIYQNILIEGFIHAQQHRNFKLYCYCIMPNHIHFIAASEDRNLSNFLRSFKSYTAKQIMNAIEENFRESRQDLFVHQFRYFARKDKKVDRQFWKHDNHAFYLYSSAMIEQKVNYIHQNPVKAGFVNEAREWRLSSANEQSPIKVLDF